MTRCPAASMIERIKARAKPCWNPFYNWPLKLFRRITSRCGSSHLEFWWAGRKSVLMPAKRPFLLLMKNQLRIETLRITYDQEKERLFCWRRQMLWY